MSERLYDLLPAIHRIRDAEHGEPLRALLDILQTEFDRVELDIARLYDDWFIETSQEWVVPYLGDLLGVRLVPEAEATEARSRRAFVANTLRYRRRKGTLSMLEELAADVTGWGAHVTAFFEHLGWTQNLNHVRLDAAPNPYPRGADWLNPPTVDRVGTVNLRSIDVLDRAHRPFDRTSHTVDVRSPCERVGWYGIRNLGFFLWRLNAYPLRFVQPRRSADYADGFHFSPLGHPAPLFANPPRKPESGKRVTEHDVPGPIRPVAFFQNLERYYGIGAEASVAVYRGGDGEGPDLEPIPLDRILCKDLSDWSPPPPGHVAIDVRLGRLAFAPGETPGEGVRVSCHHGFSADIGGGAYDRRSSLTAPGPEDFAAVIARAEPSPAPPLWFSSLSDALAAWNPAAHPRAVLTIADSATYEEELTLAPAGRQHLIIQAANRQRPTLRLRDAGAPGLLRITGGEGASATVTLNGVVIEGAIEVGARSAGRLELRHCTLVPGRALGEDGLPLYPAQPSLTASAGTPTSPANPELQIVIDRCIVGALRLPEHTRGLIVRDSIVDRPADPSDPASPRLAIAGHADEPGPETCLDRVTVLGELRVQTLRATDTLFMGRVEVRRRQKGCVRFSYVDDRNSITPRRFRCQPDLTLERRRATLDVEVLPPILAAEIRDRMRPTFTSVRFGTPGYAQLHRHTAPEVRTGAESGAEMGAFEHLKQPQREQTLRIRLEEYMPYGLEAAIIHVT